MSEESTPGTPRMQLFFVLGSVQTLPVWILADSGSVRNLIDEAVYLKLPYQPPIRDPGDVLVIGGNGEALELKGFAVLPVSVGTTLLWHEFGVVPNLPLEVLIGADVLAAHQCSLLYLKNNRKRLLFGNPACVSCVRYRGDPQVGTSTQMKFVDRTIRKRRNRLKIGSNFIATIPDAEESEEEENNSEIVVKSSTKRINLNSISQVQILQHWSKLTSLKFNNTHSDSITKQPEMIKPSEPIQSGKCQKVLAELRVSTLPVPDTIRRSWWR